MSIFICIFLAPYISPLVTTGTNPAFLVKGCNRGQRLCNTLSSRQQLFFTPSMLVLAQPEEWSVQFFWIKLICQHFQFICWWRFFYWTGSFLRSYRVFSGFLRNFNMFSNVCIIVDLVQPEKNPDWFLMVHIGMPCSSWLRGLKRVQTTSYPVVLHCFCWWFPNNRFQCYWVFNICCSSYVHNSLFKNNQWMERCDFYELIGNMWNSRNLKDLCGYYVGRSKEYFEHFPEFVKF